ncbi:MAG TPA: hypothetical protein VGB85_07700, partial [Nannocystis sp.]
MTTRQNIRTSARNRVLAGLTTFLPALSLTLAGAPVRAQAPDAGSTTTPARSPTGGGELVGDEGGGPAAGVPGTLPH